jgi:hypothetical protein
LIKTYRLKIICIFVLLSIALLSIFIVGIDSSILVNGKEETENKKIKMIESGDYFDRYYRDFSDDKYNISVSDPVFNQKELNKMLSLSEGQNSLQDISDGLNRLPDKFAKELIIKSGLLVYDLSNQKEERDLTIKVILQNINIKKYKNSDLIYGEFRFLVNKSAADFNMYALLPKGYVKSFNKVNNPKVINKINYNYSTESVTNIKETSPVIIKNNKNTDRDNIVLDIKTILDGLKNNIETTDVGVGFNLDFKFIILHSYIVTGISGILVFIYSFFILASFLQTQYWYKKTRKKNIEKRLNKFRHRE